MSSKQEKVLEIISYQAPKKIGVKHIFYKIEGGVIEIKFIVSKSNAPTLASYLNSLSSIIRETEDIQITSSVYIYKPKETNRIIKDLKLTELSLSNNFSFSC
ncbi:MAG: hypothetical protein ACWGHO_02670 [Candidatus Moraniibacteriota bacterium]